MPPGSKVSILHRRIGDVADQQQHPFEEFHAPLVVEVRHNRCGVNVIPKMKMVVVVEAQTKILTHIEHLWHER